MPLPLIDSIINFDTKVVVIKFATTIKIDSINVENFIVQTDSSTPSVVTKPFTNIDVKFDYNQISRALSLYWRTGANLVAETDYILRVTGLRDAANTLLAEEQISFTWAGSSSNGAPTPSLPANAPPVQQVLIQDHSIRVNASTAVQILAKNPEFYINEITPTNGDFYLENDYNLGRVKISFNERVASNFLSSKYFKAQRKKIQRAPSRWENLDAVVQMHSWRPDVYVDFPSLNDATPSYYTENKDYFESGYKYRIIVSKNIGI